MIQDGFIAYNRTDLERNTYMCKVLRFHEFIHYIQYMLNGQKDFVNDVMSEAYTESLALRRVAPNKSTVYHLKSTRKPTLAVFNFPAESYKYSVSLLRQMEVLMGRNSFSKDFTSYKEFAGEFVKKYGEELYTYLTVRMEMLEYNTDDDFLANKPYYMSETQDKLMKEVFRRDFDKMKTIEDAKDILGRLRKLEPERVTLYEKNNDENINQLGQYEEYYDKLLSRIAHKLLKKGYTKKEIIENLEEFEYESQQGNPVCTEKEFLESLSRNAEGLIIKWFSKFQGRQFNPDTQKIVYALYSNGDKLIGIKDKKTGRLLAVKGFVEEITHFCYGKNENTFTEEDIAFLSSPDAPEFRLSKNLYLKYKRQQRKGRKKNFSDDNEAR